MLKIHKQLLFSFYFIHINPESNYAIKIWRTENKQKIDINV